MDSLSPKTVTYYELIPLLKAMEESGYLDYKTVWREYISEYGVTNDTMYWLGFEYYKYYGDGCKCDECYYKEDGDIECDCCEECKKQCISTKYADYFKNLNILLDLPKDNDGIQVHVSW